MVISYRPVTQSHWLVNCVARDILLANKPLFASVWDIRRIPANGVSTIKCLMGQRVKSTVSITEKAKSFQ
jgi:hypothetical protein